MRGERISMSEAIISRRGSFQTETIPIVPGYSSVVVQVTGLNGEPMEGMQVHCIDGGSSYVYNTNNRGKTLFMTNSGQCNIIATNVNALAGHNYTDLSNENMNMVEAVVGTSKQINIQLGGINAKSSSSPGSVTFYFRYNHYVSGWVAGAGGQGGRTSRTNRIGGGGGGGAKTMFNDYKVTKDTAYSGYIGSGGYYNSGGASGGSSSIFGYVANGGRGATWDIGGTDASGTGYWGNGGNANSAGRNSNDSSWGGGGGGGRSSSNMNGGKPGGGRGSMAGYSPRNGTSGGGGGGGYNESSTYDYIIWGGRGGNGQIRISLTSRD